MINIEKKHVPIVVTVAALFLALMIWWFRGGESFGDNNANFPDGHAFLCNDPGCNNVFKLTVAELSDHHKNNYGTPVPCPKCKKPASSAAICPHCDTVSILQRDNICPKCGKPLAGEGS